MSRTPRRFQRWTTTLLIICVHLCASAVALFGLGATRALAQGTMGTVPDPITARDLEGYAKRLRLSDQQKQALDAIHEEYRESFKQLRETDIERVINDTRATRGGFGGMNFDRSEAEKGLKELESVLGKIRNLDNRMFDQVQAVLTDDQAAAMNRVRMVRERARYQSGLGRMATMFNPASQLDLSEMALRLNLSPAEQEQVEAILSQYESSLTTASRKMHEASSKMVLNMLDRLQALGFGEGAMNDPERRGEMFQSVRTIWGEMNQEMQGKAGEISDLNRRTFRNLNNVLASENAQSLRTEYFGRAYPEAGIGSDTTARALDIALKMEDLSAEQRDAIVALAADYRIAADRIIDQMADRIDENRRKSTMFDFDSEVRRAFQEQMQTLRDQRTARRDGARAALRELLGPELAQSIDKRVAQAPESGEVIQEIRRFGPGGAGGPGMVRTVIAAPAEEDRGPRRDRYAPLPISKADVERYAQQLGLPEESRNVLRSLHSDYTTSFTEIEETQFKAVLDAESKLWRPGAEGAMGPPTASDIERIYALRKAGIEAVIALDNSFFDDVELTLTADQARKVGRLKQARTRVVLTPRGVGGPDVFGMAGRRMSRGGGGRFGMPGRESQEHSIDVANVVAEVALPAETVAGIDPVLLEYEQSATAAFRTLLETSMRSQMAMEQAAVQMVQADGDRRTMVGAFMGGGGDDSARQASAKARQDLLQLNRQTMTRLKESLPADAAEALRRAYNKQAFPSVYADPSAADQHVKAALALPSLNDHQRTQLAQLSTEHASAYDELCEKLVELQTGALEFPTRDFERFDWQAFQNQARTRERLEFERDELNSRTAARLRTILDEGQVQQIPGLAKASD